MPRNPRIIRRPSRMAGNNTAVGFPRRRRHAAGEWVSILLSIPGRVIETGLNRSKETGPTLKNAGHNRPLSSCRRHVIAVLFRAFLRSYYVAKNVSIGICETAGKRYGFSVSKEKSPSLCFLNQAVICLTVESFSGVYSASYWVTQNANREVCQTSAHNVIPRSGH